MKVKSQLKPDLKKIELSFFKISLVLLCLFFNQCNSVNREDYRRALNLAQEEDGGRLSNQTMICAGMFDNVSIEKLLNTCTNGYIDPYGRKITLEANCTNGKADHSNVGAARFILAKFGYKVQEATAIVDSKNKQLCGTDKSRKSQPAVLTPAAGMGNATASWSVEINPNGLTSSTKLHIHLLSRADGRVAENEDRIEIVGKTWADIGVKLGRKLIHCFTVDQVQDPETKALSSLAELHPETKQAILDNFDFYAEKYKLSQDRKEQIRSQWLKISALAPPGNEKLAVPDR